ncbi:MAG TPA: rod shape-determining protein MreD [Sphingomicrobium sp.]|nr:rod shape-determining protein MreD [Sphingomicrobium sp.]
MVRSALAQNRRIGRGPISAAAYVPAVSVIMATLLSALPIIALNGWFPDFGFLALIAWRLLRADVWPSWWAAPLGLFSDLVTGSPLGLSVVVWTSSMLALDLLDRRTQWRDYWIEWLLASLLILLHETAQWQVAAWMGARVPMSSMIPPLLIAIAAFPVAAWMASRLDRWRLGRS